MIRAGGFDWLGVWGSMCADVQRSAPRSVVTEDRWQGRAARYDRRSRERAADGLVEALAPLLRPSDVVIDVGAGTGRHAIQLARACARVVAIEPSASMRELLEARVAEERLENLEIVAEPWPAAARPADVVFSAHVVYGVPDLEAFVCAMTASARRSCILVLGLPAPAEALRELVVAVHGAARPPRPAALEALAVLHQLGLRASMELLQGTERDVAFDTSDEDVQEACLRLGVPADGQGLERVRRALCAFPRDARGRHVVGRTGPNALIRWGAP